MVRANTNSIVSRTVLRHEAPQPHLEILQPINLELLVKRNLAASWFTKIPGVEVKGLLKSMNVSLRSTYSLFMLMFSFMLTWIERLLPMNEISFQKDSLNYRKCLIAENIFLTISCFSWSSRSLSAVKTFVF